MIEDARTHVVREWRDLLIGDSGVSEEVAHRLHKLADRETRRLRVPDPVLTRTIRPSLRAGQVVGILNVPGACVEILPKIGEEGDDSVRRALVHMLAVAHNLPIADSEEAKLLSQRKNLLEVLVQLFADNLLVAVRRGLPHRYLAHEDYLPLLRGKLDIISQFTKNAARPDRLACRFDELSVNTPLNRVLKAAVIRLSKTTNSKSNARKLHELAARFEFVGNSPNPLEEPVRLDRTNTAFHRLHRLACLFLSGDWQSTTRGEREGFALLFPMNDLFEAFVGQSMRKVAEADSVHLQDSGKHALETPKHEGLFWMYPDIVVDDKIVIDTKWKKLKLDATNLGVAQSDVYQMLAYASAYGAERVVLLYPMQRPDITKPGIYERWTITGTEIPFQVATVDVAEPESVVETLSEIYHDDGG